MTDLVIILAVGGAVAAIVYKKIKDAKAGKSGCGCGCPGCSGHNKKEQCGR